VRIGKPAFMHRSKVGFGSVKNLAGEDGTMNRRGIYAASFDPITNGHLWVIKQGIKIFDELIVAVGTHPAKNYTFTLDERVELVTAATRQYRNVRITTYRDQFLVHYAKSMNVKFVIRVIRTQSDYECERVMRNIDSDLDPEIVPIFVIPPRAIAEISSSVVKELVGPSGWEEIIKRYVPDPVYKKFVEMHEGFPTQSFKIKSVQQ
jgi:pantetheine-phosphate adenylyltransferase